MPKDIKHNTERKLKIAEFDDLLAQVKKLQADPSLPFDFFEWKLDFPEVLNELMNPNPGFDIVVGNPPYLRVQGIRKVSADFADELVARYKSATGAFDLYVVFAEKGMQILTKDGILNFIMPIKWVNAAFGKGLRHLINHKNAAYKFISFEAFQVFNASTYTGLQWFKNNSEYLSYFQLDRDLPDNFSLGIFLNQLGDHSRNIFPKGALKDESWVLTDRSVEKILHKIKQQPVTVRDVFEKFFTGLQTSKDSVYFILNCKVNDHLVTGYSKELKREVVIERDLLKPLLKGDQVHRYDKLHTSNYVIFPYKIVNGKAILYSEEELQNLFPLGFAYLKENENVLRGRENGRLINDKYWFRYIYPKNLTLFNQPKLICPYLGIKGQFAEDLNGEFYGNTKCFGLIKRDSVEQDYYYLLGILNSELLWYFLENTGTIFRGGYFAFTPDYLNNFGLKIPVNKLQEQKVVNLVTHILELKAQGLDTTFYEQQIDNLVYRLYELTYAEVKTIDPSFSLSEEEYNKIKFES